MVNMSRRVKAECHYDLDVEAFLDLCRGLQQQDDEQDDDLEEKVTEDGMITHETLTAESPSAD